MYPAYLPSMLFAFLSALGLALVLVPLLSRKAHALGFVDQPDARKVHVCAVPRIGGVAIFISFYCTLAWLSLLFPAAFATSFFEVRIIFLILGSVLAFGVGLLDDFRAVPARSKLCFQIVAAGLAYMGGIRIETIGFYQLFQLDLGWFSPMVTIFWIVLLINAFNIIDGLDGLAGGIGIIACAFLGYVCFLRENFAGLLLMIVIAGSLLGFLRYNFHPASVFMGDGGSYFIGYLLGTVSTAIAMANSATMTTFIPMLVVALPVIEVSIASLRRFIRGKGIFSPDKQHFHHMLLLKGLSHRNAVIVLYGITLFLGCCALIFLRIKDEMAYVLLMLFGLSILYGIAKLGYFKEYDIKAFMPWLYGIGDELGMSRDRRRFFDLQLRIASARTLPELWKQVEEAMVMLEMMTGAIYLQAQPLSNQAATQEYPHSGQERRTTPALTATVAMRQHPPDWSWYNPSENADQLGRSLFRVEMEMQDDDGTSYGTLLLVKNQEVSPVNGYTLKRIEQLKRSIVKALIAMEMKNKIPQEVGGSATVTHRRPMLAFFDKNINKERS